MRNEKWRCAFLTGKGHFTQFRWLFVVGLNPSPSWLAAHFGRAMEICWQQFKIQSLGIPCHVAGNVAGQRTWRWRRWQRQTSHAGFGGSFYGNSGFLRMDQFLFWTLTQQVLGDWLVWSFNVYFIGRKGKLELQSWNHDTSYVKRKGKRQKIRTLHTQWINGSKITRKYETRRNTQRQEESTRSRKKTVECEGTRLYKKNRSNKKKWEQ